jgi:hypothetical protein
MKNYDVVIPLAKFESFNHPHKNKKEAKLAAIQALLEIQAQYPKSGILKSKIIVIESSKRINK